MKLFALLCLAVASLAAPLTSDPQGAGESNVLTTAPQDAGESNVLITAPDSFNISGVANAQGGWGICKFHMLHVETCKDRQIQIRGTIKGVHRGMWVPLNLENYNLQFAASIVNTFHHPLTIGGAEWFGEHRVFMHYDTCRWDSRYSTQACGRCYSGDWTAGPFDCGDPRQDGYRRTSDMDCAFSCSW
ncbi:hypothetical protein BDV95DRAFT_592840 [Massariosphaeria phaeospora]|uniref:Uncharacterized protein n=1 Tax=Massariosphaeria phaeospora TaxID=100035 RepID=A0A7C8MB85_9PLEO|nr:hypothetical protein BDV95DRAFT_592840 [Massariosphaeria phaeospora]